MPISALNVMQVNLNVIGKSGSRVLEMLSFESKSAAGKI